jgi:hypothetical protein
MLSEYAHRTRDRTTFTAESRTKTLAIHRNRDARKRWLACCSWAGMEHQRLVHRVKNEFIEMPGLQLTLPQAARLWGLDHESSRKVIDSLVEVSFLRWTPQGTVIRAKAS